MDLLSRRIDWVNDMLGRYCGYFALALMVIVLGEVFTRKVLGEPTVWTFEVIGWLYAVHFMMTMPYTLLHKAHVNVDLVYGKLSRKTQLYLDLLTYALFFFPYVIGIAWVGFFFFLQSFQELERSWSIWQPLLYPIKFVIPVSFVLLALQGVSEVIKIVMELKKEAGNE